VYFEVLHYAFDILPDAPQVPRDEGVDVAGVVGLVASLMIAVMSAMDMLVG
jgi:hypothetical protein